MFPSVNPTQTKAWQALQEHFSTTMQVAQLKKIFKQNANRFEEFSIIKEEILFDYSKNLITKETLSYLTQLAEECQLKQAIAAMFGGDKINATEQRAVFHTALRNFDNKPLYIDNQDVAPAVKSVLEKIKQFTTQIHSGAMVGATDKKIKYIVNIGIGGSDLGPAMITEALKPFWVKDIQTFFVSNIDASHLMEVLKKINAEETLFIIASKTFTTQETMTNAHTARHWFLEQIPNPAAIAQHFVAISTNQAAVEAFGINQENQFEFWDWVGGRYSLWSAIGLSIALTVGYDNFENLLKGAAAADKHFATASFDKNIPVLMGLIGIWYVNFFKADTIAILPYDQYLYRLPAYLQQCDMESNGKSVDRNGQAVNYSTGPIVWGEAGTNGQHAFYQLIHQGTPFVPCDFIATANSFNAIGDHHQKLLSNFLAQTAALMNGKSIEAVEEELKTKNNSAATIDFLKPFKVFRGNIPTNSFLLKSLNPYNLGMLVAFYEHKIFVQGVLWNIFSFDQWGVELGKELANQILPDLLTPTPVNNQDGSTNGLINQYKAWVHSNMK